ncbi:TPM domain-containing protein [Aurantimonas sp. VKM B-3413]|uniref:TPM domain-containing protein n=1 Tax=Aurantimonas sp. VKM B-3413 TaxID=2779401 RepID=UPI001E48202E|nr:TPM domain-containing protein [Aurantimonas sp. VKM B-3413]MCB8840673.1 TPM domain-containing protein [Aurantimonas sp. VKM B-3413]
MAHLTFTPADHARIAAAIGQAEAGTSGEIYAVFSHASDAYGFVAATAALALALAAAFLAALLAPLLGASVQALTLVSCQLAAALLLAGLFAAAPGLRMVFVPRGIAAARAHAAALKQFAAHGIHVTENRTGVLIFVSAAERHAEIVADAGIAERVPQEAWDGIVADLLEAARADRIADGYVAAVTAAGALLCEHFPSSGKNTNELPDRLVVI